MIFEVCASSFESARNAQLAGAQRIELCTELGVGGITPSYGLISKVMDELSISNCVLIRPRSGDFTYSDSEFDVMLRDIKFCRELNCDGVVTGVLHKDGRIDVERTQKLIEVAGDMDFIYHRAFDCTPNPEEAIEILKNLGVKRILSSGQKKSAIEGLSLLKKLNEIAGGFPSIMPGGGINSQNIQEIKNAGFNEIHFSATIFEKTAGNMPFSMNSMQFLNENVRPISDIETIKRLMEATI
ncbi:copper homeostasis protein CutC [Capnocytophaga catalasegens]|uniref:PF03932 family protein CutC n=1 Tax=Capnocytophaga catalasegens TaxID=1004260 RepID=A0AAV5AP40_9FLAO|nr:copper homeostasis protein CutC [Capnocytophaga catalasegens]GIZ14063.1 copper homeostasis protein CutC [Capnocytophaga catalasegens]GJM49061.1 copper homeostasis protein CutC [Capnocytophaga catalasegens]GJM52322.1 copper homeostasis protein CutC [Capnocytophaga catalasegens]